MPRRPLVLLVALVWLVGGAACGGNINLSEALAVTDILSGYYDNGIKDGKNHLVPSITFRLKNQSTGEISSVEVDVAFWEEGKDAENDSVLIRAIGGEALQPGASTEPLTVRAPHGYMLEQARADLFTHSMFHDFIAKMFAKRGGRIFPIGQFKLDRRIIPQAQRDSDRP